MSKQEDTAITEDIPVAYEVSDTSEAVPADIITIQNIDSKYIVISDNSRKIKILVSIQGIFNLVFTILIYHWYIISVILCYLGFLGAKKYKYKYLIIYNIYLLFDFGFHITYFMFSYKSSPFLENVLSFLTVMLYVSMLIFIKNFIKSIMILTEDEINLIKSIKITSESVQNRQVLLI